MLHRLQWIDAQIRAGRYPNTKALAEAFEISRRQALRDFEYLRDSLGAPLEYSALKRGYCYTTDAFTLPGPFVTGEQQSLLKDLAAYYEGVAKGVPGVSPVYGEVAELFHRLIQGGDPEERLKSPVTGPQHLLPFRAWLQAKGPGAGARLREALGPFWRGVDAEGHILCEFQRSEPFLSALLGAGGTPLRVVRPEWLRRRLNQRLMQMLEINGTTVAVTRHVTPDAVCSSPERQEQRRSFSMNRTSLPARLGESWHTYGAAAYGVLTAAGLIDMDVSHFMAASGTAFRFIIHDQCDVSAPTTYPWWTDHGAGLDRLGVLTEVTHVMPDTFTYEAARARAVEKIKASLDRGIGVVLWGVDTGEFGVVYGYDDGDGVLFVSGVDGFGPGGSDPIRYENLGRTFPMVPIIHYQIPIERISVDPERTYRSSLEYYVAQMEKESFITPVHHSGLRGYEAWRKALAAGDYQSFGLRYSVYVYAEMKHHAAAYAKFLAESWRGIPELPEVAALFAELAAKFAEMHAVLGQKMMDGPEHLRTEVTAQQAAALLPLITQAAALERQAVQLVKRGLASSKA